MKKTLVVAGIAALMSTSAIAQELNLSVKTIETYRAHIKDKLGLANAAELVSAATRWVESQG